ncbi:RagB/SusD family nutrient uptake outer membrane protein [Pedobacter sp. BMA]|uniref:RagB/SusD family nutrient uptake outer membrane protein n=1 Tax=Pedobacter sp. BMA TaxID=1663685 RepID=UPI000649F38A|nr:RagB/SusD family nutrient uptake outer membrane protein [Pedobacter sp. BMA]KLT64731.1 hypothetical protein AB669_13355 [Pedobacter sp. BMA]
MKIQNIYFLSLLFILSGNFAGCKKEYLEAKPSLALTVPTTAADMQGLLDYLTVMNVAPALPQLFVDDIYIPDASLASLTSQDERNVYSWKKEIYSTSYNAEWKTGWEEIFYANIVLDGIAAKPTNEQKDYAAIKGAALFFRALAYYNLAQIFTKPYNPASAGSDKGLPIREVADVNANPPRGILSATYAFMLNDLTTAVPLLSEKLDYKSRPNRMAALALLARISLIMQNYNAAYAYANQSLRLYATLINYNTLSTTASRPFPAVLPKGNDEVLFATSQITNSFMLNMSSAVNAAPELYAKYTANDLRKVIFFNASGKNFKGNYNNASQLFGGIANDEVYLIRAETAIRLGDIDSGLADINTLLLNRYKTGTFVNYTKANTPDPLKLVIDERRKQLPFRGQRMADLRRLNQDPVFKIDLTRTVNGVVLQLPAGDERYVFPIPQGEIQTSGMEQN